MREAFEKFMFEQYGVEEPPPDEEIVISVNLRKIYDVQALCFQAGALAGREAVVQYIIDQGTVGELDLYYIDDSDIEAIRARVEEKV